LRLAREIGWRSGEGWALGMLGFCLAAAGSYRRAFRAARECLAVAEEIEHRQWEILGQAILAAIYLDLLALPEAQSHMERGYAVARELQAPHFLHSAGASLVANYLAQGDVERARSLVEEALKPAGPPRTYGQRWAWFARAQFALATGDAGEALSLVDHLLETAANVGERPEQRIPALLQVKGEALAAPRRPAEAEAVLLTAWDAARAQQMLPLLWRIGVSLGRLQRRQHRTEKADRTLAQARAIVGQLAADFPEESLRDNFLRLAGELIAGAPTGRAGTTRPRRLAGSGRAARSAPGGLTPRECEVAALIARGYSNRAIGEALVVTERTAESYVHSILSKLNLSSRSQIAVWAVEQGLTRESP
jgi:ATP/maltotriose-dependent transcriptional regulator MalT